MQTVSQRGLSPISTLHWHPWKSDRMWLLLCCQICVSADWNPTAWHQQHFTLVLSHTIDCVLHSFSARKAGQHWCPGLCQTRKRTALLYRKSYKTSSTWGEFQSQSGFGRPSLSTQFRKSELHSLSTAKRCFELGSTAMLSTPKLYLVILHVSVGSIFQQH